MQSTLVRSQQWIDYLFQHRPVGNNLETIYQMKDKTTYVNFFTQTESAMWNTSFNHHETGCTFPEDPTWRINFLQ